MAEDAPENERRRAQEAHRDGVLRRLRCDLRRPDAFPEAVHPGAGLEAEVDVRSKWRVSILHPLRSAYVRDSHEDEPLTAMVDVEKHWHNANPSLDMAGVLRVDIRRVHEDDEVGA